MNTFQRTIAAATLSFTLFSTAYALNVGEVAPDFARADISGKPLQLSKYRGKLVLLNFWATWCGPCREEMPAFSKWQTDYGTKGLQVIGMSMDDDADSVKQFLTKRPVSYPIVMADAKLADSLGGVLGLPLSYLIDEQGRIVARYQGETNLAMLEAKVKELVSRPRK